jgi:prepilin-type N-terminal cleavage/methylation domain-containing protein
VGPIGREGRRRIAAPDVHPGLRRGLTLIEVVAALALMAALLVTTLTIKSGLTRRRAAADRQLRAVAVADQLLAGWWRDPATFPVGRSGPAEGTLGWSTRELPNAAAARLGGRVVRVDLRDAGAVVLSVDVLLPPPGGQP